MTDCTCSLSSAHAGTCDRCIESGRSEATERHRSLTPTWPGRPRVPHLSDGEYPLRSGGRLVVRSACVTEVRAPGIRDPGGWGTTIQAKTTEEASELVGAEIFAGFWRCDPSWYVAKWPVLMPSRSP
jgi:hypothetical protein